MNSVENASTRSSVCAAGTQAEGHRLTLADLPQLASCEQMAEVCGCSARHIARMCERGELKAVKLGRLWRINRDAAAVRLGLV